MVKLKFLKFLDLIWVEKMKFSQMLYERPDTQNIDEKFNKYLNEFKKCSSFSAQKKVVIKINKIIKNVETMENIARNRHNADTRELNYRDEVDFFDKYMPLFEKNINKLFDLILSSKFLYRFEKLYGNQFIKLIKARKRVFNEEILKDLVEENRLENDYNTLMSQAEILFNGNKYSLEMMNSFLTDESRKIRRESLDAVGNYLFTKLEEIDDIYDKLVKIRHKMALKLGFKNFVEMAYLRLGRTDYDSKDIESYRKQIVEEVVPISTELYKRQQGVQGSLTFHYHDEKIDFRSGYPYPKGNIGKIITNARKMYNELSPEIGEFFSMMVDKELMDLVPRRGKSPGGYCSFLEDYKLPYIFANFNRTIGDITVLTHEMGHAFQTYLSKDIEFSFQRYPGYEAAEIHSMGMEMITWPWMGLFFEEDKDKFYYSHAKSNICFLPYGALVDHFQHDIYENPEMRPEERRSRWKELEKIYLPHRDYADNEYFDAGTFWQRQIHIFCAPFYYIDYTLAQVVAFQIYSRNKYDSKELWKDYMKISSVGGTLSFLEILDLGNFKNPFINGTIKESIKDIKEYLFSINIYDL